MGVRHGGQVFTFNISLCTMPDMARPLRIEYAGALYHITSRGNARGKIFLSDEDNRIFLNILRRVIERYGWKCYSYCLMQNHYHLLIETPAPNLSLGMRQLNGVYTQSFNHKHKKTGHVFQGRFKALVVEKQNYLLALSAYIVLNPVRAKIVNNPGDWEWSSYNAPIGKKPGHSWLCTSYIIEQFGASPKEARLNYQRFVADQAGRQSPWNGLVGQLFVGGSAFIEEMAAKVAGKHSQVEIPRQQRQPNRPELKDIFADAKTTSARNAKIVEAHIKHGYKQAAIAKHLNLHYVTVSRTITAHLP